jgi:hypothetical protein
MEDEALIGVPDRQHIAAVIDMSALVATFLAGRSANTLAAYQRDREDFRSFVGHGRPFPRTHVRKCPLNPPYGTEIAISSA